jgi:type VI secretion system secreted protein VgrG
MANNSNRLLELEIPAIDDSILAVELDGEDYISYPFNFNVLALSDNHDLLNKELIGKSATITIGNHNKNPQYYNGLIYSITGKEIHNDGLRTYQIIISSWLRFLDLTKDNRIYAVQKPQTIPQIVQHVFKYYNCTDYDISNLKQQYEPLNYCVQYQESAFNFVSRLLEQAGIYYYFAHTQNKHTLILADSGWFNANPQDTQHIFEWQSIHQLMPNATTTLLKSENITAKSTYHQYHAGTVLKIKDNYYIYSIKHQSQDYSHRIGYGNKDHAQEYQNSFHAYPSKQRFVPLARHKKPIIEDIRTATVTGPKGKEIYTDKYGRIKVQFHWDRYGNHDENSSCWIRLKQLWAGDKYGSSFIPRIGQEVLVSHEHGNPDLPIVTGIVPNNDNMMPFTPEQTPTQSGFRSVRGNELRFEDQAGQEEIYIKAQKDLNIKIDGSSKQTIGQDSNLNILQGDYLNTVNGNLTIESAQKIALACGTSEIIITDPDITIQADQINLQQGSVNIPENPGTSMQDVVAKL